MSFTLVGMTVCALFAALLAGFGLWAVSRVERPHVAREAARRAAHPTEKAAQRTGDVTLFVRFEGDAAEAATALVRRHGPHGVLPIPAIRDVAEALVDLLPHATHAERLIATFRVVPVRIPVEGGAVLCFRAQSRAGLSTLPEVEKRPQLAAFLKELAAIDPDLLVSGDLLMAERTRDGAAPQLMALLG